MTVPPVAEFINTLFSCTNFQWLVCAESQFFCQNGSVFEKISLETVVEKLFAGGFTFHIRTVEQNFLLSLDETEANILAYAPAEGIWKPFPLQRVKSDPNSVKLASLVLFPHVPLPVRGEGGDSLISHFFPSSLFFEYSVKEKSPDGSPSLAFPKTPSAPSSCSNLRLFLKVDVHCGDDALHQVILTNDSLCVQSVQSNVIADYRKCFLIEVLSSNGLARIWTLSGKCWTAVGNHKVELTDVEDKKKEQLFWIDIKQAPHQADRLSVTFFSDPSSSYVSFDPVLGHLTLSKTEKTFVLTTKVSASSSSSSSSSSFSPSSSSSASYPSLQFSGSASSLPLSSIPLPRNFLPETAATVAFSALTPPPQHHELLLPPTFNTPPQQPHHQHHQQQQQQQQHFVPHQQQQQPIQYQQSSSSSNQSPSEVKQLLTPASSSVPLPTAESYLPSAALMSELPQAFYAPIHSSLDSILPPPVYGHSIDYSSPSSSSSGVPFAPYATGPVLDVQKLEEKKKLEQDIENKRKELEHINLHLQKQNQIKQQNDHHLAQQNLQIQQSMVQIAAPTDASYVFSPQELNMLGFAQKLGEGTSGTVYRAVWNDLDVAVKAIRSDVPFSQSQTDDFLKEIAIMRDLRHPNILMFYGVVLNPLMMVMEFMEGGTLFQNLQKNITVNTSMALQWALQIARGMYYLHSRNPPMLHRDLKSLNVLINREGKAVLADFGFTIKQKNTVVTSLAGSVLWAAPEVLRQTPYDGKADVYSFGVLLYELAVRSPPYAGVSPNDVGTRVAQGTLRPTPLLHTSQAYRDLSERCLSYNPDHRPHFHEIVRILKAMIAANDCLWPYPPPPVRM